MRSDNHRNPAAVTTDIAKQAGLVLDVDYTIGDAFPPPQTNLHTARFLGDPIQLTRRIISAIGFYTKAGAPRWTYIQMPKYVWKMLSAEQQRDVIGEMYRNEAGTEMRALFPNYGKLV